MELNESTAAFENQEKKTPEQTGGNTDKPYQREEKYYTPLEVKDTLEDKNHFVFLLDDKEFSEELSSYLASIMQPLKSAGMICRMSANERNQYESFFAMDYPFKEVYFPWKGYNKTVDPKLERPKEAAYRHACWYKMNTKRNFTQEDFNNLPHFQKAFSANLMHLLLGEDLFKRPGFILINSTCGSTSFSKETGYDALGFNASEGLRASKLFGTKVINIGTQAGRDELQLYIDQMKG